MFYRFLRVVVRWALHVYFRRVSVDGIERVPLDKPLIIACNHPNSFLEAVILACFLPRPLHFLVRGDVFKNPRFRWFFRMTNQVPIYRFRDGFSNLRNNAKTFEYCYKTLQEGKAILIFAEGSTEMVKRLRPLQKGAARIAMGAMSYDPNIDLQIVPIGVNFSDPTQYRSHVSIKAGQLLSMKEYFGAFQDDEPGTLQVITDDLTRVMKPCVINIPEHIRESEVDPLFSILRFEDKGFKGPFAVQNASLFQKEWSLANRLGDMSPQFFDYLLEKLSVLERLMPRLHFRRPVTVLHKAGWGVVFYSFMLTPIYYLSMVFLGLPWGIAHLVATKKVKQVEFYAPVRLGAAMLLTILWWVVIWVIAGLWLPFGWYWGWALTPIFLFIRIYGRDHYLIRRPGIQMQWMNSKRRKKIRNQYDQLYSDVVKLANKEPFNGQHFNENH